MTEEGPVLETLTRRLAECPNDFLSGPRDESGKGDIEVAAVVYDLLRELGGAPLTQQEASPFKLGSKHTRAEENRLRVALVACWLLHDSWFRSRRRFAQDAYRLLAAGLDGLAELVQAAQLVADADRREELARLCLKSLGLRPAGETEAQSEDRLATLDSVEMSRVVREARAAEERARKIREEMARKAAEEAASVYGRE
jgi:hypothetical protein